MCCGQGEGQETELGWASMVCEVKVTFWPQTPSPPVACVRGSGRFSFKRSLFGPKIKFLGPVWLS